MNIIRKTKIKLMYIQNKINNLFVKKNNYRNKLKFYNLRLNQR